MNPAAREKGQGDFDLDRFIDMFDQALTSDDPRVVDALRSLMMLVILTKPESADNLSSGPLRKMFEHYDYLSRRMSSIEDQLSRISNKINLGQPGTTTWTSTGVGVGGGGPNVAWNPVSYATTAADSANWKADLDTLNQIIQKIK